MLGADSVVKIADFGLTRLLPVGTDRYILRERMMLPVPWMSPEAIDQKYFTHKTDVWASD